MPKVNYTDETVTATFFGVSREISEVLNLRIATAKYLGPQFGCSLTMSTFQKQEEYYDFDKMKNLIHHSTTDNVCDENTSEFCELNDQNVDEVTVSTPQHVDTNCINKVLDHDFTEDALAKNQSRAIVVSYDGKLVAERYQTKLNIHKDTKLLGWSMTKSVFSTIVGAAINQGLLTLDTPLKLKNVKEEHRHKLIERNNGKELTFRHLLQMHDILGFVEDYGIMKDVVFMLYGTYETVKFSSSRPLYHDDSRSPSDGWYYSSAVSNLLSSEFKSIFSSEEDYWKFPHEHLFGKINATTFAMEMDPQGIYVASSFAYAVSC